MRSVVVSVRILLFVPIESFRAEREDARVVEAIESALHEAAGVAGRRWRRGKDQVRVGNGETDEKALQEEQSKWRYWKKLLTHVAFVT